MSSIENIRIQSIEPLLAPAYLKHQMPIPDVTANFVAASRQQVADVIHSKDSRPLVVVGPCSVHDPKATLDYAERLQKLQQQLQEDLLILMRVYFEKPRTTIGWKGFINDPKLDHSCDINNGIIQARELLLAINGLGLPVATEFLDTITPQYISDLVSWAAIGARTTESQVHRNLASGLSMPVGFKNGTTGNVQVAVDAVVAANNPHHFLSVTEHGVAAIVQTEGNSDCHIILRGGTNTGPNFSAESVEQAMAKLSDKNVIASVMIDCSHGNSQKQYAKQADVLNAVATQIQQGNQAITGVMLESFIEAGNQKLGPVADLQYGVSVTDACLDWRTTEQLLVKFAHQTAKVRG